MADNYVECMWTCNHCKQAKVKVEVRARMPGEDILKFTKRATARCGSQHRARSPKCPCKKLDIYLPIGKGGRAGFEGKATPEELAEIKRQLDKPSEGTT